MSAHKIHGGKKKKALQGVCLQEVLPQTLFILNAGFKLLFVDHLIVSPFK